MCNDRGRKIIKRSKNSQKKGKKDGNFKVGSRRTC